MRSFSIIIPTYRRPASALACLRTLEGLRYPREKLEVVLVEDGPGEEPLKDEDLAPFRESLRLKVVRQENAGPAAARNRGAAASSGDFLAFTDDDCKPESNWIQQLADSFDQNPNAVIGGHSTNALRKNRYSEASQVLLDYIYEYFLNTGRPFFASNNIALSRTSFDLVGGFDESFQGAGGEDRQFCANCLNEGLELVYEPKAVIQHYHALTLKSFLRQHFNYGRGAFVYHTLATPLGKVRIELEPLSFYSNLIRHPRKLPKDHRLAFGSSLMLLSQAANAYGYFFEKFGPSGRHGIHEHKSQTRLVAREASGTGMANILGIGSRYVAMLGATHILGTSLFGDYTLSLAITGLLVIVSMLGLAPGLFPFLSRARADGQQTEIRSVVRSALLAVTVSSIVFTLLASLYGPWASQIIFDKPHLHRFLVPLSMLILVGTLTTMVVTLLQGFIAVKERAWIEKVLVPGTIATGMCVSWWLGLGASGVIWATLTGSALGLVVSIKVLSNKAPGALSLTLPAAPLKVRRMLSYSWPLMGTSMLAFLLLWTDVLSMGVLSDSQQVGAYGAAARVAAIALLAHESLGPIFMSRLSDLHAANDWSGIRHLYKLTARWALWPGIALAWALSIWSVELLNLFGPEFRSGAAVLTVLCFGKAVASSSGMAGRVLGITGRARLNLLNMTLMVGGNIALNIILIPAHGGLGAAAATCICITLVRLLQVVQIRVLYNMYPWGPRSLTPVIGISLLAALIYPLRSGVPGSWGWLAPFGLFLIACAALFVITGAGGPGENSPSAQKEAR
ncbi:MAG: glycosyltransferase [bacterium]|nr:glycosyltransferase [bacterium]